MTTLVDTNVLVDIAVRDPNWLPWSRRQVQKASAHGPIVISQVVMAEFSTRYETFDEVDRALPENEFLREGLPWEASFAAGRAFARYRKLGGAPDKVLPDFLIGAHAAIRGYTVLTRDPSGFRRYFPSVPLVSPDTHP